MLQLVRSGIWVGTVSVVTGLLTGSPTLAESWDFFDRSAQFAVVDEGRVDESFEGTKITFEGRYFLHSAEGETSENKKCCIQPSRPTYFGGLLDAGLRWGLDGNGLEYVRLGGTPRAVFWEPEIDNGKKLRTRGDLIELLPVRYISDDALEVDYYLEVSLFRAGRSGIYRWSRDSAFTVLLGAQASFGWAWAESQDRAYSTVSNPMAGGFLELAIQHERLGELYSIQRYVNGFSFSNPSRGHPTAREARVRFGYLKEFADRFAFDVFFEKRSFYFVEGGLPQRYTEAESLGAALRVDF